MQILAFFLKCTKITLFKLYILKTLIRGMDLKF